MGKRSRTSVARTMVPPSCVDPDPGAWCESSPLLPVGSSQRGLVSTDARILSWWRRRRRERTEGTGICPRFNMTAKPFVVPAADSGDGKGFYFGAQPGGLPARWEEMLPAYRENGLWQLTVPFQVWFDGMGSICPTRPATMAALGTTTLRPCSSLPHVENRQHLLCACSGRDSFSSSLGLIPSLVPGARCQPSGRGQRVYQLLRTECKPREQALQLSAVWHWCKTEDRQGASNSD